MLSLLLTMSMFASGDTRWLQLCDKETTAPKGSLAWENAPLREDLLDSLKGRGWTLRHAYKWENKISAIAGANSGLPPCVSDVGAVATAKSPQKPLPAAARSARTAGVDEYTLAIKTIWDTMGIESVRGWLAKSKLQAPGAGVTIAVIDGLFVRKHLAFAGMSIKDTFDFVRNSNDPWDRSNADWSDTHGTTTTSLIGSSWEGIPGIAPAATFLLYRAEDAASESTQEEDNLAAAFVRAVDSGADVISVSLGYRFLDDNNSIPLHPWEQYNGRTLVASRAATAAARHGAVVVVAAGNEGRVGKRSIGSPADADSVLTVSALDGSLALCNQTWAPSYGPTADGRQKPDIAAFGCSVPVAAGPNFDSRTMTEGTSVATPLVAGLAALARQSLGPKWTADEIRLKILHSGHLWPAQDTGLGSGLPDLRRISEIKSFLQLPGSPPPNSSRPGLILNQGVLRFSASSATLGSTLGVEISDAFGRQIFQRESMWRGEAIWKPSSANQAKPGLLFARWWGDYGKGSTRLLIVP